MKKLFDSHHVIERQTILMGTSFVLLIGGIVVSNIHNNNVQHQILMRVDQSGTVSSFSKTSDVKITLGKTYLSSDRKTAFIPITFNTLDKTGIKANNYKLFLGDAANKKMQNKFSGNLILYPSTNRGVIVLKSSSVIKNQPLALFIMNLKNVSSVDEINTDSISSANKNGDQSSFGGYDVAPFKINPGATTVTKRKKINVNPTDIHGVYTSIFKSSDESDVQKVIKKDKKKIQENIDVANELRSRLELAGYEVPDNPPWLSNNWKPYDAINLNTGKTKNGKDALSYVPSSSDDDPDKVDYPNSLNNNDGSTTDSNSVVSDDSTSSSDTVQSTPSQQWSDLQSAWDAVKRLKRDIYVTQYKKLYKYRKEDSDILKQASISKSSKFKQFSKVDGE